MPAEGSTHERCDLPEEAVITAEVEICSFVGDDGGMKYSVRVKSDSPKSTVLGLVEMAKFDILHDEDWDD